MEPPTKNRSLPFRCSILYGWLTPTGPPTPMQGDQISTTGSQTRAMLVHCALHLAKDGFGSDTDEIGFECHILPHFNSDTNANADLIEYEYKTDSSNSDTFSI